MLRAAVASWENKIELAYGASKLPTLQARYQLWPHIDIPDACLGLGRREYWFAVLGIFPLPILPHGQLGGGEVHILPPQAQGFAMPHPGQGDRGYDGLSITGEGCVDQ